MTDNVYCFAYVIQKPPYPNKRNDCNKKIGTQYDFNSIKMLQFPDQRKNYCKASQ